MAEYLEHNPLLGEVLMPVPLHSKRHKGRGYNQSQLLTCELGRITGIQVMNDYLRRTRATPPQTDTAGLKQRLDNVSGAFTAGATRLER
jgi:predicted amidophosphoribosyltransferase